MKLKLWGFVVVVIALLATGCKETVDNRVVRERSVDTATIRLLGEFNEVYVFNVNGHEYIWVDGDRNGGLVHSESCQSPTHIAK